MMSRLTLSVLVGLVAATTPFAQLPSPGGAPSWRVAVASPLPSAGVFAANLEALGYDVWDIDEARGEVQLAASAAEHQALSTSGLAPLIVDAARPLRGLLGGNQDGLSGYHDLAALDAAMLAAASSHPGLAQVVDVTATHGPGSTFEGRAINVLKISDNVTQDEDEPEVLIVALHHCREIVTPEIALDVIDRLLTGYGTDPAITALVDENEIFVAPYWNPDGLEYVWNVNNMWRKNRRPIGMTGEVGVDLNRNYDFGWSGPCAGSTNPPSSNFKGPAPESEAETQTMVGFARSRRFAKILDYHSSGREVLLGYLCTPLPATIEAFVVAEGTSLAGAAGYGTRDPSAEGEHYEWQIKENTTYSFLVETQTSFQPPYPDAVAEAARLWPQTLQFLSRPVPLTGLVTDNTTGAPIEADIRVVGVDFLAGETRRSRPGTGRYRLFLPAGSYQVRFSSPGFAAQTVSATVTAATETTLNVQLSPVQPDIGQPNTPAAALEIAGAVDRNGALPAAQNGPYFATVGNGAPLAITFGGPPMQPFALLFGPLNRNNQVIPGIGSLDIGFGGAIADYADIDLLLDGISPGSLLDLLAVLGGDGTQSLTFTIPGMPPGPIGTLQALVLQTTGPVAVLTAATELTHP